MKALFGMAAGSASSGKKASAKPGTDIMPGTGVITVTPHSQVAQTKATALDSLRSRGFSLLYPDGAPDGADKSGGSTYQRLLR